MSKTQDKGTASTAKKKPASRKKVATKAEPSTPRGGSPIIANPARKVAFAASIKDVCEIFGIEPGALYGREPAFDPLEYAVYALRKLALGACAKLGRDLELPWHALHGEGAPPALVPIHRASMASFARQFGAWSGLDIDGHGTAGKPTGGLAKFARDRYTQILADAMKRSAAPVK